MTHSKDRANDRQPDHDPDRPASVKTHDRFHTAAYSRHDLQHWHEPSGDEQRRNQHLPHLAVEGRHRVKQGETLSQIAQEHLGKLATKGEIHRYVDHLAKANGIHDPNVIRKNQILHFPQGDEHRHYERDGQGRHGTHKDRNQEEQNREHPGRPEHKQHKGHRREAAPRPGKQPRGGEQRVRPDAPEELEEQTERPNGPGKELVEPRVPAPPAVVLEPEPRALVQPPPSVSLEPDQRIPGSPPRDNPWLNSPTLSQSMRGAEQQIAQRVPAAQTSETDAAKVADDLKNASGFGSVLSSALPFASTIDATTSLFGSGPVIYKPFDQERFNTLLQNTGEAQRTEISKQFQQKYGKSLEQVARDNLSGNDLEKTLGLLKRKDGDVASDRANVISAALMERGNWVSGRSSSVIEKEIRDTLAISSPEQIQKMDQAYRMAHPEVPGGLAEAIGNSWLSKGTKEAAGILLKGTPRSDEDTQKLAEIGLKRGDAQIFQEAMTYGSPAARQAFLANDGANKLAKAFFNDPDAVKNSLDYARYGKLDTATQVNENRGTISWTQNDKAIENALSSMTPRDRGLYFAGKTLADGKPVDNLSDDDKLAAKELYGRLNPELKKAAGSNDTEMMRLENLVAEKDGGFVASLARHRGTFSNSSVDDISKDIANMSQAGWQHGKDHPEQREQVEKMLGTLNKTPQEVAQMMAVYDKRMAQGAKAPEQAPADANLPLEQRTQKNRSSISSSRNDVLQTAIDVLTAKKEEKDLLKTDTQYQEKVMGFLTPDQRKVVMNALNQGELRDEDRVRALTLGYNQSSNATSSALENIDPSKLTGVKGAFAEKYGVSMDSDVLNNTSGTERAASDRALSANLTLDQQLAKARTEAGETRSGFMAGLADFLGSQTGAQVDNNLNQLNRQYALYQQIAPALDPRIDAALQGRLLESRQNLAGSVDNYADSKDTAKTVATEAGVTAIVAATAIPTFGGSVVLGGGALAADAGTVATVTTAARLGRLGMLAAEGGMSQYSLNRMMSDKNYNPSIGEDLYQTSMGAVTGLTFGFAPGAKLIAQSAAERTESVAAGVIDRMTGAKDTLLPTGAHQAILGRGLKSIVGDAVAAGGNVDKGAVEKLARQLAGVNTRAAQYGNRQALIRDINQQLTEALTTELGTPARMMERPLTFLERQQFNGGIGAGVGMFTGGIDGARQWDTNDSFGTNLGRVASGVGLGGFSGLAGGTVMGEGFHQTGRGLAAAYRHAPVVLDRAGQAIEPLKGRAAAMLEPLAEKLAPAARLSRDAYQSLGDYLTSARSTEHGYRSTLQEGVLTDVKGGFVADATAEKAPNFRLLRDDYHFEEGQSVVLGRNLVGQTKLIGKTHAIVGRDADGMYVQDLGAKDGNGTWVRSAAAKDGEFTPVAANEKYRLKPGDELRLGGTDGLPVDIVDPIKPYNPKNKTTSMVELQMMARSAGINLRDVPLSSEVKDFVAQGRTLFESWNSNTPLPQRQEEFEKLLQGFAKTNGLGEIKVNFVPKERLGSAGAIYDPELHVLHYPVENISGEMNLDRAAVALKTGVHELGHESGEAGARQFGTETMAEANQALDAHVQTSAMNQSAGHIKARIDLLNQLLGYTDRANPVDARGVFGLPKNWDGQFSATNFRAGVDNLRDAFSFGADEKMTPKQLAMMTAIHTGRVSQRQAAILGVDAGDFTAEKSARVMTDVMKERVGVLNSQLRDIFRPYFHNPEEVKSQILGDLIEHEFRNPSPEARTPVRDTVRAGLDFTGRTAGAVYNRARAAGEDLRQATVERWRNRRLQHDNAAPQREEVPPDQKKEAFSQIKDVMQKAEVTPYGYTAVVRDAAITDPKGENIAVAGTDKKADVHIGGKDYHFENGQSVLLSKSTFGDQASADLASTYAIVGRDAQGNFYARNVAQETGKGTWIRHSDGTMEEVQIGATKQLAAGDSLMLGGQDGTPVKVNDAAETMNPTGRGTEQVVARDAVRAQRPQDLSNANFDSIMNEGKATNQWHGIKSLALLGEFKIKPETFQKLQDGVGQYIGQLKLASESKSLSDLTKAHEIFETKVVGAMKEAGIKVQSGDGWIRPEYKLPMNPHFTMRDGSVVDLNTEAGLMAMLKDQAPAKLKQWQQELSPFSLDVRAREWLYLAAEKTDQLDPWLDPAYVSAKKEGKPSFAVPLEYQIQLPERNSRGTLFEDQYQLATARLEETNHLLQNLNNERPLTRGGQALLDALRQPDSALLQHIRTTAQRLENHLKTESDIKSFWMENELPAVLREYGLAPTEMDSEGYFRSDPFVQRLRDGV